VQANCKEVRGSFSEYWAGGNDSTGIIANSGWLNGTTLVVFNSAGFPTPVSSAFSYTGAFVLTTSQGQLKGTRLFVSDLATGWGMDMTAIEPLTSTGVFAGATGVLYVNIVVSNVDPPPTTYVQEISGRICFAR
jgi:hypothetical protein